MRHGLALSLPALLPLVAALGRDLQADMLPLLPRFSRRLAGVLKAGAERDTVALEAVFSGVSELLKHLAPLLAADLPFALKATAPLRNYATEHVRAFAAQVRPGRGRGRGGMAVRGMEAGLWAQRCPWVAQGGGATLMVP